MLAEVFMNPFHLVKKKKTSKKLNIETAERAAKLIESKDISHDYKCLKFRGISWETINKSMPIVLV